MTQEEKELLLADICARLPYDVYVHIRYKTGEPCYGKLTPRDIQWFIDSKIENIKPYLRHMSSMTEEEREELSDYLCERVMSDKSGITFPPDPIHGKGIPFEWMSSCIDWLNAHHFDYRGLIEKGLALEAPENMYKF